MKRETYRSIGAILGVCLGGGLSFAVGLRDITFLAISGATGAVVGGITGERIFDSRNADGNDA